jgi:DNA repair exonuclease SbcCD ATPase subunit
MWDLFNPKPEFNYEIMDNKIEIDKLNNPYVQVVWEDFPENFTQEKIRSVRLFFQKKYKTTNVNVITKVILGDDDDFLQTVDVSFNIMDRNYQTEMMKNYLKAKSLDRYTDEVLNIDKMVENKIAASEEEYAAFKKWYIRKIEFSNFLSYGDGQVLDFEKCNGITVIESNPPNFGGKTVLSVDLLMFLFFNTTTKTTKAEEIFNRFTDKDKVTVKGEITIDGEDYLIVRNLERKKAKSGDWNVKTELDFFKKLPNGELHNYTGEQRRETENFIKNSIGEMDDFLMTILTTSSNLEDLLDSKPTARGQVLSRFLGLEFLKKKEEVGKELYSSFSKTMMSNLYSTQQLEDDIEESNEKIRTNNDLKMVLDGKLEDTNDRLSRGEKFRDELMLTKHTDIDKELSLINPENLNGEILVFQSKKEETKNLMEGINVVPPSEFYNETEHDKIREAIKEVTSSKIEVNLKLKDLEELARSVDGGIKCEHCGIELLNAELTKSKLGQVEGLKKNQLDYENNLNELNNGDLRFQKLKREFDQYERNILIREKYEVEIQNYGMKIQQIKDKLGKFYDVQNKIEENKNLDGQIMKATMRLDELKLEKGKIEKDLSQIQNENELLVMKIEKNQDLIGKIAQEFEREKIYKIYLEIFGKNGISKMIMKTMMPLINSELQRLLQDSSYFKLEVRINEKNEVEFIMVDNATGIEKLMVSGSGYEKTVASLALRAVLTKVCSLPKPNILVLDEVFGKISNDNLDMVGEFLIKIRDYFEKIFVITHNPLVSQWANNTVKITKTDNISKVSQ